MGDAKKSSIGGRSTCHLMNIKKPGQVKKRLKLTFQRVEARISCAKSAKVLPVSLSLLDITEDGSSFFMGELLTKGSGVELWITGPYVLKIRGVVAWCIPVQSGMDQTKNRFRVGMQFYYFTDLERAAVGDFCRKINTDPREDFKNVMPEAPVPVVHPTSCEPPVNADSFPAVEGTLAAADIDAMFSAPTPTPTPTPTAEVPAAEAPVVAEAAPVESVTPAAETPVAEAPAAAEAPTTLAEEEEAKKAA